MEPKKFDKENEFNYGPWLKSWKLGSFLKEPKTFGRPPLIHHSPAPYKSKIAEVESKIM